MWFWQMLEIIGRAIWAVGEALFSLFPVYQQLSDFKTQIIAAAIGVPVAIISVGGTLFAIGKFLWRRL